MSSTAPSRWYSMKPRTASMFRRASCYGASATHGHNGWRVSVLETYLVTPAKAAITHVGGHALSSESTLKSLSPLAVRAGDKVDAFGDMVDRWMDATQQHY